MNKRLQEVEAIQGEYSERSTRPAKVSRPGVSRAHRLRELIQRPALSFILEAHNGLSAKIVEQAGFDGIWASGLTMSAALGVRDCNEASWTQILENLEFMSDATEIPILLDGDTGYGNFNNVRRLVRKLCQRGISGVCLEDKIFPKTNSLLDHMQPLADVDEFCGKLKAAKDAQLDEDFCVIARVEALIAKRGLGEALRRAKAYRDAGADAILIHSKANRPDEILAFSNEWSDYAPLVIVPTTYYATPTEVFRQANISLIIWANHVLRASISAMRAASQEIFKHQNLLSLEGRVASVQDIFLLTENSELENAEKRYLAAQPQHPVSIVLAAGRSEEVEPITAKVPKCMLDVRGRPLIAHLVDTLRRADISEVKVIRGHCGDLVNIPSVEPLHNPNYLATGEIGSLGCAADHLSGPCVVSFGDVLFRDFILRRLLEVPGDVVVAVDSSWKLDERRGDRDLVRCSRADSNSYFDDQPVELTEIGGSDLMGNRPLHGRWIGLMKLTTKGSLLVRDILQRWSYQAGRNEIADLLRVLIEQGVRPRVLYIGGHWIDADGSC